MGQWSCVPWLLVPWLPVPWLPCPVAPAPVVPVSRGPWSLTSSGGCASLPGSGVLAILLVALLLDPIRDTVHEGDGEKPSVRSTLLSTFKLLRDRRLRILVLMPMYNGFEQAFLAGEYTRVRPGGRGPGVGPGGLAGDYEREWQTCM